MTVTTHIKMPDIQYPIFRVTTSDIVLTTSDFIQTTSDVVSASPSVEKQMRGRSGAAAVPDMYTPRLRKPLSLCCVTRYRKTDTPPKRRNSESMTELSFTVRTPARRIFGDKTKINSGNNLRPAAFFFLCKNIWVDSMTEQFFAVIL